MKMNELELKNIKGGGFSFGTGLLIGGFLTFLIGIIDGYIRPLACR